MAAEDPAAEAAATRRRWITLAEVLAVFAAIVSGLTLWNSWRERDDSEITAQAEQQNASAHAGTLVLVASTSDGHELILRPASPEQAVQSQTISFPTALGLAAAETTGKPRIEAVWFEHALKNARGAAGLPGDSRGDERLPVAIDTRYLVDGNLRDDLTVYDIGYSINGHWLVGHTITLHGLSLVARGSRGSVQAMLDRRWQQVLRDR